MLSPFENENATEKINADPVTKTDFYSFGLSGGADSRAKRDALAQRMGLPSGMTANALLEAIKILASRSELLEIMGENETKM